MGIREVIFRGKRIDNGEWVEGYYMKHINRTLCPINDYVKEKDVEHIIFYDAFSDWNMPRGIEGTHIDPATLGQYTGLTDKNGKKIFEGDILKFRKKRLVVWWNEEAFQWQAKERKEVFCTYDGITNHGIFDNIDLGWIYAEVPILGKMTTRVIGNIHDNESLEGE